MKKYPLINLRLSQDLEENLKFLSKELGIEHTDGAYPKIIRMAVRSLKHRILSLQSELGDNFVDIYRFKIQTELKGKI